MYLALRMGALSSRALCPLASLSLHQPAHVIGSRSSSCVFIPLAFSGGRRFFVTVLGLSVVQLVDTSDPWRWRTLQEISLPPGTYPHAATAARWAAEPELVQRR